MTDRQPIETTNLDIYGHAPLAWSRVRGAIDKSLDDIQRTWFLGTVRSDGRPHVAGVGALWHDGAFYVVSGPRTQKSRNLEAHSEATLAARLEGLDVVFEGFASRVTDPDSLENVAAEYRKNGWPAEVAGDAFTAPYSAPSAGPPPWNLYRFTFVKAIAVAGDEPNGATRWRFDPPPASGPAAG
jgi:hypothetical protein